MIDLRTLGSLDLRVRDGAALLSVLSQPKRTALLCHLALARPRGFQRRDTLLALFWPDADTEHARSSLRQAVHFLRRALGDDVIASRGDEDLAIGEGILECDAVAFEDALAAGERERALALYRGDLLPGFYVEGAPDFERWLEAERARLRGLAVAGAWALAEERERAGDAGRAADWTRAAFTLASDDAALRRLMQTLERLGDRQAALAAYETWARRLKAEYELETSAEARALAEEIRRRGRAAVTPRPAEPLLDDAPAEPAVAHSIGERRQDSATPPATTLPPPARSGRWRRRWWLSAAALAFVVVALGGALALRRQRPPRPQVGSAEPASVAVLPLEDLSPGHDQQYFADGLTEELITLLGAVPGLRVPGRTSSFYFRDKRLPVQDIARQLGVRHVLEGSVRRVGRDVTVSVQFTEGATGSMVWSQLYEAAGGDVIALQNQLARSVLGAALGVPLRVSAPAPRIPEAYDLYLRGLYSEREEWNKENGMDRTLELFKRALDLDPGYAPARAALAHAYYRAGKWELAKATARQALAGDSTLPLARIALAGALAYGDWRWRDALREMDRAIELAPSSPDAYVSRAVLRSLLNGPDDALADYDRAGQLDPFGSVFDRLAGLVAAGRYDEAIAFFRRIPPSDSSFVPALEGRLFRAYLGSGRRVQAESLAAARGSKGDALWARGNRAEMLDSIHRWAPRKICALNILAALEMTDSLVACLEKFVDTRYRFVATELRSYGRYPDVAANPRYQALLKRVGLDPLPASARGAPLPRAR